MGQGWGRLGVGFGVGLGIRARVRVGEMVVVGVIFFDGKIKTENGILF